MKTEKSWRRSSVPVPDDGEIGLLECTLPRSVCVLTLFASLSRGNQVMEQNQIPVYVGEKGMLEAAF